MSVKTETFGVDKNILIAPDLALTYGAVVTNTGISADSNGRKILKAGTPLAGDLLARNTAFVKASTTGEGSAATSNAVCVILHDVDVTDGAQNATIVVTGSIDLLKLESDVQTLVNSAPVLAALSKIVFVKGGDR